MGRLSIVAAEEAAGQSAQSLEGRFEATPAKSPLPRIQRCFPGLFSLELGWSGGVALFDLILSRKDSGALVLGKGSLSKELQQQYLGTFASNSPLINPVDYCNISLD